MIVNIPGSRCVQRTLTRRCLHFTQPKRDLRWERFVRRRGICCRAVRTSGRVFMRSDIATVGEEKVRMRANRVSLFTRIRSDMRERGCRSHPEVNISLASRLYQARTLNYLRSLLFVTQHFSYAAKARRYRTPMSSGPRTKKIRVV
jgi:hypothetical protein